MPAIDPKTFDVHETLARLPDGCRLEIRPVIRPTHADFEVVVVSRVSGEYRYEPKSQHLEDRIRDAVEEFRDLWGCGEEEAAVGAKKKFAFAPCRPLDAFVEVESA